MKNKFLDDRDMKNLVRNVGTMKDFPPYQTDGMSYVYRFGYQQLSNEQPDIYTFAELRSFKKLGAEDIQQLFLDFEQQFGAELGDMPVIEFKKEDYKL